MNFKSVDRYLNSEIGVWEQTIDRWESEGLPKGVIKNVVMFYEDDYFGLDIHKCLNIEVKRPYPFKEKQVISEDERHQIFIDELGIKRKGLKIGNSRGMSLSMDMVLENPIKDRDDWNKWLSDWPVSPLYLYLANGVTTIRCFGPHGDTLWLCPSLER